MNHRRQQRPRFLLALMETCLAACLLIPLSGHVADPAPTQGMPALAIYEISGKIQQLDVAKNRLIVGDWTLKLAPGTKVYSTSGTRSSTRALKPGMRIGCVTRTQPDSGASIASEIWILGQ